MQDELTSEKNQKSKIDDGAENSSNRIALIAGASGMVGHQLMERLLKDSDYSKIILLTRRPLGIQNAKIEEKILDFDEIPELEISAQVTDLFCTLGTTRGKVESSEAFQKVDWKYVEMLAHWGEKHNVRRFLVISAMGASSAAKSLYMRTKGLMEESVRATSIPIIGIFRPSLLVGNRKERRIGEWIAGHITLPIVGLVLPKKYKRIYGYKVANSMWKSAKQLQPGIHIIDSGQMQDLGK